MSRKADPPVESLTIGYPAGGHDTVLKSIRTWARFRGLGFMLSRQVSEDFLDVDLRGPGIEMTGMATQREVSLNVHRSLRHYSMSRVAADRLFEDLCRAVEKIPGVRVRASKAAQR